MQSNISSWTMINKLNYYYYSSFNWSAKPLVYFVNFDVNAFKIKLNEAIFSAIHRGSLGFQVRFLDAKDGPLEPSDDF
jgi:hypothetical protein